MAKSAIEMIQELVEGSVELNVPMSKMTTMRTGGPADILITPAGREDLAKTLRFLHQREIETFFMGNGSSMIVKDGGIRGAVIKLDPGISKIERLDDRAGVPAIRVDAGVTLRRLVRWSVDEGISGLEYLFGIPGQVGGAFANNSGAWDLEFSDHVLEVETMDVNGEIYHLGRDHFNFEYRKTTIPEGHIILSVVVRGEEGSPTQIKDEIRRFGDRRRAIHPLHDPSAGMIFFNPKGFRAGEIIDECGLKGVRVGECEISRMHANFIVNLGAATSSQIVSLIGMIQERVYVKKKLKLETKVKILGDWQKSKLRIQE